MSSRTITSATSTTKEASRNIAMISGRKKLIKATSALLIAVALLVSIQNPSHCASVGTTSAATAATTTTTTSTPASDNEFVIDSLGEDGKTPAAPSERHHYEPQVEPATLQPDSAVESARDISQLKAEPRNQEEQADPVIVDHRPSGDGTQQDAQPQGSTTTQAPVYQPATTQASVAQQYQISAPSSTQQLQQPQLQSQQGWFGQSSGPQQQQFAQTQSNNNGQQQGFIGSSGTQVASSNQVYTVHHPTSINSIISEQQQQQPAQQQLGGSAPAVTNNNQQQNPILTQSNLQGQPTSLILQVNPNGQGRRISISNWLKGISSMVASIFNRREHGTLTLGGGGGAAPLMVQQNNGQQQPQAGSSSSIGHWLQLGPNAPHWLTQAQSLLQQQQYHHQFNTNNNPLAAAASATRFTLLQAPQQQAPQTMTITMQPATNTIVNSNGQYQSNQGGAAGQQADMMVASGSSPTSYMTIAAQPTSTAIGQVAQVPAHQPQQVQQTQPQVQATVVQQQQAQNQQLLTGNIIQATATQPSASQLQQQVNQGRHQTFAHQPASQASSNNISNQQPQQQQQHQATRFGRSSSSTLQASQSGIQQNLPLAHYTRLASS